MLSLQVFTDASLTGMLADLTSRVHPPAGRGFSFTTNRHGFGALSVPLVPMTLSEAFEAYDWPGTPHVVVSDQVAGVAWEGRLEDVAIVEGGVALTVMGYQRALKDALYTALWSKSGSGEWKPVGTETLANSQPQQYEMDNNNRLYIAPRKGEQIRTANSDWGVMSFATPHGGARDIAYVSFDYSISLPSGWRVLLLTYDDDFSNAFVDYTHFATGGVDTGTVTETLGTPNARIAVAVQNNTGSTATISGDTGDIYARLTNIRIKTTTAASVLASSIAAAMAVYVNGVNPDQLTAVDDLIAATTDDLQDELYEDTYPADILDRLAGLHAYEWGVYEGRRLHFRGKGSAGRSWYVDVTKLVELQRSLEKVCNSAMGVYRSASGRTMRTASATDAESQGRYALTRQGVVKVQTTSLTEAQVHRDTFLNDRKDARMRARIAFDRLYDEAGGEYPLYVLRAGDTVTMRNLPPTTSAAVDRIRSFVVGETSYSATTGEIDITPEEPVPTLVTLVARREVGL